MTISALIVCAAGAGFRCMPGQRRRCSRAASRTPLRAPCPANFHAAGAADLRAGGQARGARRGQCLCPHRWSRRRSIRFSTIRFFSQFFGASPELRQRVQQSLGSGVIVRADGVILTNNHVVEGGTDIVVALSDKREFKAQGAAGRSAHRSCGAQDRHQGREAADRALRRQRPARRWAIWCWRSAIPSASARP